MLLRYPFAGAPGGVQRGADRIRMRADGRFDLLGRADGVVKIGGTRVALAEIERELRDVPGVADAAVIAVDTPSARQHELWAAVVAPALTVEALRAALLRRLEPIALPRRFRIVAVLPREDSGKLVRARLLALFDEQEGTEEGTEEGGPEKKTIAVTIPADWRFFRGHFDDFPVLAGVVQLNEIVLRELRVCWPEHRHLRQVIGLKFRKPIGPGDVLELELVRAAPGRVAFELRRGTIVATSGTLEFLPTTSAAERKA
jgi:3-hydroxymyristoyl/3-hydroxydecanoyl-(acyl carrier protein) dehydratase